MSKWKFVVKNRSPFNLSLLKPNILATFLGQYGIVHGRSSGHFLADCIKFLPAHKTINYTKNLPNGIFLKMALLKKYESIFNTSRLLFSR
jgi:hypothetical protein